MRLDWGGSSPLTWGAGNNLYWGDVGSEDAAPPAAGAGGGAGTTQRFAKKWWDSHPKPPKPPKRKKVVEYAHSVAQAFAKAQAKDAKRLAERTEVLERLIEQSSFNLAYLTDTAEQLRAASIAAAHAETARLKREQLAVAAEIAHRLEMELQDEEEATLLLLMA